MNKHGKKLQKRDPTLVDGRLQGCGPVPVSKGNNNYFVDLATVDPLIHMVRKGAGCIAGWNRRELECNGSSFGMFRHFCFGFYQLAQIGGF